ncbi:4Fe-4S binding protein [Pseudoramibacter sp.]|jgi:epoxyqueuosine reductase QueG|uniref:4Fe-4S binding protein n=1 Tax=Pseudoramibacter sp. TaxID=2034862 RepID=UPI0025E27973|nr:4Fe-4S binding protein [Pseudoramibacter sp.]MCH4071808.1 4Fe-4S binding protein [Pseudoramibacter sp.]MCH4105576.1 4Fe-4S binding protein [Pseudoramibacter sp.]
MKRSALTDTIAGIRTYCPGNTVGEAEALTPACAGLPIFQAPLIGVASAADPLFEKFKEASVVGGPYAPPAAWLPGARSVICLFFPFNPEITAANGKLPVETAPGWLHGRIEGQAYIIRFMKSLVQALEAAGHRAVNPASDPRFSYTLDAVKDGSGKNVNLKTASAWPERHAAYAAGLGTFGLSKGLITKAGIAGRLGSVITNAAIPADNRPYTGIYDYCIRCGACVRRCPAHAIALDKGKNHKLCYDWMMGTKAKYAPRLGCGKCQCAVPCAKPDFLARTRKKRER